MPRQEGDPPAFHGADDGDVRRFAERSPNSDLAHIGQAFHLIQTTATDYSDLCFFHYLFSWGLIPRIWRPPPMPGTRFRSMPATLMIKSAGTTTGYFSSASSRAR